MNTVIISVLVVLGICVLLIVMIKCIKNPEIKDIKASCNLLKIFVFNFDIVKHILPENEKTDDKNKQLKKRIRKKKKR